MSEIRTNAFAFSYAAAHAPEKSGRTLESTWGGERGSVGTPPVAVGDGYAVNVYDEMGTVFRVVVATVPAEGAAETLPLALAVLLSESETTPELAADEGKEKIELSAVTMEPENVAADPRKPHRRGSKRATVNRCLDRREETRPVPTPLRNPSSRPRRRARRFAP